MAFPSIISIQSDKLEMETSKTQANSDLVDFHIKEDSEWFSLDAVTKGSLDEMEKSGASKTSLKQAEKYTAKFKAFLRENRMSNKIEKMSVTIFDEYLRLFDSQLRNENGALLSPTTLGCIRSGINRYLIGPGVNRQINIIADRQFAESNRILIV